MTTWQERLDAASDERKIEDIEYDRLDPPTGRRTEPEHFAELTRGMGVGNWRHP